MTFPHDTGPGEGALEGSGDASSETTGSSPRRRLLRRPVLSSAVAVVLIGSGVGTSLAVNTSAAPGADTPADAVQQLFAAADNADVLSALAVVAPGERSAIEPGLTGLVDQLKHLDVLSSSASLSHVDGLSLMFSRVQTSTTFLTSNLAAVSITSGKVNGSVNLAQLPLGSFVRGLAGSALTHTETSSSSAATGRSAIATVEQGGRWYVSLGYTAAVHALRAKGESGAPRRRTQSPPCFRR